MTIEKSNKSKTKNEKIIIKKKSNLKPLFFTFAGTFILCFFTFTVLLPILTPVVEIPAFTDEYSISSVTSNDFKGRIDPRLSEIEQEENAPPKLKMEILRDKNQTSEPEPDSVGFNETAEVVTEQPGEPESRMPWEKINSGFNMNIKTYENYAGTKKEKSSNYTVNQLQPVGISRITSRQVPLPQRIKRINKIPRHDSTIKVILGSYETPMQARLVADALIETDFNVAPFIKENGGRYLLQLGSFSDAGSANSLVRKLQNKGFNARAVYE